MKCFEFSRVGFKAAKEYNQYKNYRIALNIILLLLILTKNPVGIYAYKTLGIGETAINAFHAVSRLGGI